jgi:hypothetical protein
MIGIHTMKSREEYINALGNDESMMLENEASTVDEGKKVEDMRSAVNAVEIKKKKNGLPHGVHKEETSDTQGKDKRLTGKMHAFASNIVQGMSPRLAYEKAYDTSKMSHASIVADANKLLKDARITLLLESFWNGLKENVIADQLATKRHVMAELFKHAQNEEAQLSNRLKSLELMGRAVGMFTDKVEQKVEEVNVDTLKKELESSLALLESNRISKPSLQ